MARNPRAAWSRGAVSGLLLATTLLVVLPALCDCWWWGATPVDTPKEETPLDAIALAIRAAEEAANQSQVAREMAQHADSNATAAEMEADAAEAKLTGMLASIFGVSQADREKAEQLRNIAKERRMQVAAAYEAAEKAMVFANQTQRKAEIAQNASSIAEERHEAEKQLNTTKETAQKKQSGLERIASRLETLKQSAKTAQVEFGEASNLSKTAKADANAAKREVELLKAEVSKSVRSDEKDDNGNTTAELKKKLKDAMEKRDATALKARQAHDHLVKSAARAKELDQQVFAATKDAMQQKVDTLETQRHVDIAQGEISLKKAKEEETRARMEMAVLESKLHDTAAALAALEKASQDARFSHAEAAKALEADARWREIQEQQESHAAMLQAQILEQQNRSVAEKEHFEKLLLNKTDAERQLLLEEHNRTETERRKIEEEKAQLQKEYQIAVEQVKRSEEERLKVEHERNATEAEMRRIERLKNETLSNLTATALQKQQIEENKTKVEKDLQARIANLTQARAELEAEKKQVEQTLQQLNATISAHKKENRTRELAFQAEKAALNQSIAELQNATEKLRLNLTGYQRNISSMERERAEKEEEMTDMQETIDALRGFLPPAFVGPRRIAKGLYGALTGLTFSIWRTIIATLLVAIVCVPYLKKVASSADLLDLVLGDMGVDLHVVVGLGSCYWFGAWVWGISWVIVFSMLSVVHFQTRRDKLARNAARIAHPPGLKEKKAEDRAHPKYVVQVWIKSAVISVPQDQGGAADPYVVVNFGNQEPKETEILHETLKPEWNQMFEFEAEDMSTKIKFGIFDWDLMSKNDLIGTFQIWVADIVRSTAPYAQGKPQPFPFRKVEGATKKGHVVLEWTWRYRFQDQNQQVPWYEKALTVPRALGASRDATVRDSSVNLICRDAEEAEAFLRVLRVCAPSVISAVESVVETLQPYAFPYQNLHVVLAGFMTYWIGRFGLDVGFVLPMAMLVHKSEVCYTTSMYKKHWQKVHPLMDHRVRALNLWQTEYIHEKSRIPPEFLWDVFQRIRSDMPHCLAQPDTMWLNGFLRLFWDIYRPWLSAYLLSLISYFAGGVATVDEVFPGKTAPQLMNIVGVNGSYADVPNHRYKLEVSLQEIFGFLDPKTLQTCYATIGILSSTGESVAHETEVSSGHKALLWTTDSCVIMVDPKNSKTEKLVIRIFEGHPPTDLNDRPAPASCAASVIILVEKLLEWCPAAQMKWDGTPEVFEQKYQVERYSKLNTLTIRVKFSLERTAKEKTTKENMGNIYVLDADIVWDTELFVKITAVGMGITIHIKRLVLPARLVLEWCHPEEHLGKVPILENFDGDFKEFARAFNTSAVFPNLNRIWMALRNKPVIEEKIDLPVSKNLLKAPGIKQLVGENFLPDLVYSFFPMNIFGGAAWVPTFYSDQLTDKLDVSKSEGITRQGKLILHILRVSIDENITEEMRKCNWYCVVHYGKLATNLNLNANRVGKTEQKEIVEIEIEVDGQQRNTQIKWGTRRPCFSGRFEFDVVKPQKEALALQFFLKMETGSDKLIMNKIIPMVEFIDENMLVADSYPKKLKLRADSCKIEALAEIRLMESSDSNFDRPALEESPAGLEQYELRKKSDGQVQNFSSMLKSVRSIKNHKASNVDDDLFRTSSSVLRESSKDVGWMGLGEQNHLLGTESDRIKVTGMPGTLAVKLARLKNLPDWARPTEANKGVELVLSLKNGTDVVELRTESWQALLNTKSLDEAASSIPKNGEELVAKRSVVFTFEIPRECARHSITLRLRRKAGHDHKEDIGSVDWLLGRMVSPGDGSFVSCYRDVDQSLVLDKGIEFPLFPVSEHRKSSEHYDHTLDSHERAPKIGLSLSFQPWDAAAEPSVLVTVHKAKDLPWFQGFIPPDSYCTMYSEFRPRDPSQEMTALAAMPGTETAYGVPTQYPDDCHHHCPSRLPCNDRDQGDQEGWTLQRKFTPLTGHTESGQIKRNVTGGQKKSSSTVENELNPEYKKKFLFYVNREMLDTRHHFEQILVLRVYQEAYDTAGNKQPAKEVGYHSVSVRKMFLAYAAAKRVEEKAKAALPEEERKKMATTMDKKELWRIRESTKASEEFAEDSVSIAFLGDWSHATEEADEVLDEKMMKYNEEQRLKLAKEAEEALAKEAAK